MILPRIKNSISDKLAAGVNVFINISVKDKNQLKEFINAELKVLRECHLGQLPPGFSFSRKLYRAFSIDPTKYRPSSEALWRRIKRGLEFPFVNPFVDLTNLLSLKYQVSYGLYDLDKIEGDIEMTQGGNGNFYQGIRKDIIHLKGKIVIKDRLEPFGNPSSDSIRTCTSATTTNVLQVIFFHIDDPLKEKILSETHAQYTHFFEISDSHSYIL